MDRRTFEQQSAKSSFTVYFANNSDQILFDPRRSPFGANILRKSNFQVNPWIVSEVEMPVVVLPSGEKRTVQMLSTVGEVLQGLGEAQDSNSGTRFFLKYLR